MRCPIKSPVLLEFSEGHVGSIKNLFRAMLCVSKTILSLYRLTIVLPFLKYAYFTFLFFHIRLFCHLISLFSSFSLCFSPPACLSPLPSPGSAIHQTTLLIHSLSLFTFVNLWLLAEDLRRTQY